MMEARLQAQEDEITLLKSSLAEALRRIHIHDQQAPLLWQELIAVNPAAARTWSQFGNFGAVSKPNKYLSSSALLNCQHSTASQAISLAEDAKEEKVSSLTHVPCLGPWLRPATLDRATQTDPIHSLYPAMLEQVPLAHTREVQSLSLEDAFSDDVPPLVEGRSLLQESHGVRQETREEEKRENDQGGGMRPNWASLVEEPIQPSSVSLFQEHRFTKDLGTYGPLDDQNPVPLPMDSSFLFHSKNLIPSEQAPVCPSVYRSRVERRVLNGVRRNTEKLVKETPPEKTKPKLGRKAVSSASLLTRSNSLESRAKDLISSAGSSRRGTYSQGQSIKMFIRGRPITMYVPSNIQNYDDLRMEPPAERLELEWVYGYRGRDCRANLFLLPSREAVYFTACVVVLYHINNRTQRHYRKHTDCVRCLAVHPDQVRIASGQTAGVDKDGKPLLPFVHIWDSSTLVTLQQIGLGSFERGVNSLAFSRADSGVFLVVIDDSNEHMLSVWDWARATKQAEIKSTNEAVFAVEFNPSDSCNIITCGKSHVYFWTLSGGVLTKKQGIFGKYKKPKFIQCFLFSGTGDVLTGDSEGNILTWGKSAADVKTLGKGAKETYQIMRQTRAHEGSVFTLCVLHSGALLSGGGKDRRVVLWSVDLAPEKECEIPEKFGAVRTIAHVDGEELLVGTTRNAILRGTFSGGFVAIVQARRASPLHIGHKVSVWDNIWPYLQGHVDEMWGLATHPSQNTFLTCGHDKQVFLWNAEEHMVDWCTTLEEAALCADFCPNGSVVSVGLYTGRWLVLDLQTREIVFDCTDGNEQLSVMRYSPDGSFLAVGSHDNFIYIYNVSDGGRRYTRFGKCTGHSSFITHLDWSKDGKYIMSNSGDYEILYWDVAGGCKLLRNRFDSRDRKWASYTCVLGFHVMGVWLEGSDGTDINALCRSRCERMVAVADDFCKVHLFQYPCPKPKAPSHRYEGHGSHVTNVGFTHNDSHLLSMGGKDTSILQWRVRREKAAETPDRVAPASSSSNCIPETGT
ncbi:echinoderm microtubule-associated protein-like 3-like [Scleropages formosus]|uniref:Echinoderm microtubule-associated protein-like 3-like n=1 Tax=Scleropages formosus TaxID=113540 RepID=A0A0P7V3T0_SCLFO|nr:echinoderm microtubule-associated protein-like 3-like [Scleropages formosus]